MLKVRLFKYLLVAVSMVSASFVVAQSEPAMNFHRLNDRLATGGHLIEGGAAELKEQGVTVVINLRDDSPTEEQQQFIDQGIEWINIPVEWRNPESSDYARFS